MDFLIYGAIYAGCLLMGYSILCYVRFARSIRDFGGWDRERQLFNIPIVLMVLFLAGYLAEAIFGHPTLVIAAILFGGSVFVLVMLLFIQRAVNRIHEQESLKARLTAAEEASRAKTFFLSNMSHDIRTPLNAIIGFTGLARREGVTEPEKDDYIRKIESAGRQLLDIVNDVLEMSRIESGRMDLEPERMDLEAGVREAADLVQAQLEAKSIDFDVSCEVHDRWILCDKNQLNRALMNLLCNAGKFTPEHGRVGLTLLQTGSDGETGVYEIRVSDNGIGMSPEFVEHLFTPFERERTSTVSRTQGTGLGMAITKSIIDRMGGSIDCQTEKGKGTEFTVTLTLPLTEKADTPSAGAERGEGFSGKRLLLAEDNPINTEIAVAILRQAGFTVETAENGKLAAEMVAEAAPGYYSAVLMDIQMPVMNGYEAARAIRALPDPARASVPIVALTANAFREDVQAAEAAGMNVHIAKPLDVQNMMDTLDTILG